MSGMIKLTASIAILLVAGLAMLLVFDIIPPDVFSTGVKKILLVGIIVGLTSGALAFISQLGK
jgi:hypothetical protein